MPAKPKKTTAKTPAPPKSKPKSSPKSKPKSTSRPEAASAADSGVANKARYLQFVESVLNGGNFSVAADFLAPEVCSHNGFPDQQPGAPGYIAALKAFHGAFPDLRFTVQDAVAEGDWVVCRFEVTGTHRGAFLGMPASGRRVQYQEIAIVRMVDGRIAEHWSVADALAILQQLQSSEIF